ncbi:MAG: DNA methyltransferase, partial [Tannerellaceae bacterium]
MALKTSLSYTQVGNNLKRFHDKQFTAHEFPFQLMLAIGASETMVQRYRDGKGTVATYEGLLIKGTLAYREAQTEQMLSVLQEMKSDAKVKKATPALLLVSDGNVVLGYDPAADESYENRLDQLYIDYSFFTPMWGISKYRGIEENPADVKAAEKMAKLHDEIRRENEFTGESDLHDLNIFMTRLLFCFFAEDTGIFADTLFTESIRKYTKADASDLSSYIDHAFCVMDMEQRAADLNHNLTQFPYVNGGLFSKKIQIPKLGFKARKLILECGSLDWKKINPDIFGSMIQAVVTPELRSGLGMHYTSVPNIMKLIGPLFLDELEEEVKKIEDKFLQAKKMLDLGGATTKEFDTQCKNSVTASRALMLRMSKMKFFDPACGSGNFLIITYKNMRLLEMRLLKIIQKATKSFMLDSILSMINISQFYGIELDDFACETAVLSLWLAEHQMNREFTQEFGVTINALPLKTNSNIHHGNACRIDWNSVCPHTPEEEVYIMGNPPYLGSKLQNAEQKEDIATVFGKLKNSKILDYIAIWFYLAAKYINGSKIRYAFVSTNSITQGEQVSVLWPEIIKLGLSIKFAHTSFKWTNNAKYNAGVICVIIGVGVNDSLHKRLYKGEKLILASNINPYLSENSSSIIYKRTQPLIDIPKACFGAMPYDNGNLILSPQEKQDFVGKYPELSFLIKRMYGSEEFINDKTRYCFWISDSEIDAVKENPIIAERIEKTKNFRLSSSDKAGRELASRSHQFREHFELVSNKVIIPSVSSERRNYIPIGYLDKDVVISNAAFAIYDAPMWLFGVLTSKMHMTWVATV